MTCRPPVFNRTCAKGREGPAPWKAEPTLNLEAGLLDGIAKNVHKFFLD